MPHCTRAFGVSVPIGCVDKTVFEDFVHNLQVARDIGLFNEEPWLKVQRAPFSFKKSNHFILVWYVIVIITQIASTLNKK